MELESVMKELYASEINHEVSSEWDGYYVVRLGCTYTRKFVFEVPGVLHKDIPKTLHEAALLHYPDSKYALDNKLL